MTKVIVRITWRPKGNEKKMVTWISKREEEEVHYADFLLWSEADTKKRKLTITYLCTML